MFFQLTYYDGTPFRIKYELIDSYGFDDTNGANAYISQGNYTHRVKDTVEEIDKRMAQIASEGWK